MIWVSRELVPRDARGSVRLVAEVGRWSCGANSGRGNVSPGTLIAHIGINCWKFAHCLARAIADLDGIYDPSQYNDRLLLGLKGTTRYAELHIR